MYAPLLLRSGLLAAMSALPSAPVGGPSLCPTPEALWHELERLLTPEDLRVPLGAANGEEPAIRVNDLGTSFQVSLLGKAREYRDEARDCARRARIGALFAALVIDPSVLTGRDEPPPAVPRPVPETATPSLSMPPAVPTRPLQSNARLEAAAAMMAGLDGPAEAAAWGGIVRLGGGGEWLGPVLGVGGFWPTDTTMGGVRFRQWRMPADIGLRATARRPRLSWYAEIGAVAAILSERGRELATPKRRTVLELGARVSVGARLSGTLAPFLALTLELIPDPPSIAALPVGAVGRTSYAWLSACAGLSWGAR